MVQESIVLLRVKHLQKCARWVPVDATSDLVYLIDEDEGVLRSDTLECLNDLSWKGTALGSARATEGSGTGYTPDVGPSMTLDLRNVRQPAHGKPEELPPKCSCDRFTDRSFAHTWRAGEADDLAFHAPT
jgi:hypothetical protein